MGEIFGRVMTVAGSQITVHREADRVEEGSARIGAVVKVSNANGDVVAAISAVRCEINYPSKRTLFADLLGEILPSDLGRGAIPLQEGCNAVPHFGRARCRCDGRRPGGNLCSTFALQCSNWHAPS
jgi:hypothetical protein